MAKQELLEILDEYEEDDEVDLAELLRDEAEARAERIEMLEERQHQSGFFAFQDELDIFRGER